MIYQKQTLNCAGRLVSLEEPQVMGILNVTPDSFYDGGTISTTDILLRKSEEMLEEGATFIDVGGMSSRPGAAMVPEDEERKRVLPAIELLHRHFPEALLSIDTVRAVIAEECITAGACIINDISAGSIDKKMFSTVAKMGVPYILMHMQGTPDTMQTEPVYKDVVQEVLDFFIREVGELRSLGIKDIILDPGFGFGKTVAHNYRLLTMMHAFQMLECPTMAGISRKSMICKVLEVAPAGALNGTTALHMVALQQGAKILRVHDVRQAREVIQLWQQTTGAENSD